MKKNKLLALVTGLLSLAVLSGLLISNPIYNTSLFSLIRSVNYDNLSVTFNSNSSVIGGSIKSTSCILGSNLSISGLRVKAIINNSSIPMFDGVISRFNNDYASVYFTIDDPLNPNITRFQKLKSISFGYRSGTTSGNFKVGWSADNSYWNDITVASGTTIQELPVGAHYLRVVNDSGYAQFTSFTLNYSCSDSPIPDTHSIQYYGTDLEEIFELVGIDTSSLVYTAETGSHVVIEPVALLGYEFYDAFESSDYIADFVLNDGVISFTMPDHDVDIAIAVETIAVELTSISVTGQTTEFTVGDTFEFDGTVTAYYSDGSEADVTDDADIDEPDMYESGEQTVAVSYSDGNVTKSFEYTVTVSEPTPVTEILSGTYVLTQASKSVILPTESIIFNGNTGTWAKDRSAGTIHCEIYFSYVAYTASRKINMTLTGYVFPSGDSEHGTGSASDWSGGTANRAFPGFYPVGAENNTGLLAVNRNSFTIDVFVREKNEQGTYVYNIYETYTFTKQSA